MGSYCAAVTAMAQESLQVYTNDWPPYVRSAGPDAGSASRIVRLTLDNMNTQVEFRYFDYSYSYYLTKSGRAALAFPYFKTKARQDEVLFSASLFTVRNRVFYNRQFHDFASAGVDLREFRFGQVAGYSYGEKIDALMQDPVVFESEIAAIEALLSNSIDLLPITDSVASAILLENFPNRKELVRPVPELTENSTLHVIAPNNAEGKVLIEKFDASLQQLLAEKVLVELDQSTLAAFEKKGDVVELAASEGFPIVVGVDRMDRSKHFAIPQGTHAVVIQWSDKILKPAADDRLYRTMVEESLLVILDGPHVGKELFVKNMHIAIVE